MATSEGIPSSIDIEFLELNDNPYSSPYSDVLFFHNASLIKQSNHCHTHLEPWTSQAR